MRKLITNKYFNEYQKKQRYSLSKHIKKIDKNSNDLRLFAFVYSSVYSSLIEGSSIDMDSYLYNKEAKYQSKEMKQIDDLIEAYKFAKKTKLNYKNLLKAHSILSKNFEMPDKLKGVLRDKNVRVGNMFVTVYSAIDVSQLENETAVFFNEIDQIVKLKNVTLNEAFYYASLTHLVFVKIHPFADGNGRAARLLEKWVLSTLIGDISWSIPSEINYWIKRKEYYENLKIGKTYQTVDYSLSNPFLQMLPSSFGLSKKYYKVK